MSATHTQAKKKQSNKIFPVLIAILASFIAAPDMAIPAVGAFLDDILVFLWNAAIIFFGLKSFSNLVIKPLYRIVFPDTKKVGQKIEWYNKAFKHLTPLTEASNLWRYTVLLIISLLILNIDAISSVSYPIVVLPLRATGAQAKEFISILRNNSLNELAPLINYFALLYAVTYFENRSRIVAKLITLIKRKTIELQWLFKLKKLPWDEESENFKLVFMSQFVNEEGSPSLIPTPNEEWVELDEDTLKANTIIYGPTGASKTTSTIKPAISQFLFWKRKDLQKKVALFCADPKGGITEYVESVAKAAGRQDDMVILSLGGDYKTNVIQVDRVWAGDMSNKIASWIITSWQNYQGKSSPEPFWENQSYNLVRNILAVLFVKEHTSTTITDVSRMFHELGEGIFTDSNAYHSDDPEEEPNRARMGGKVVTKFGKDIFAIHYSTLDEEKKKDQQAYLSKFKFQKTNEEDFSEEAIKRATDKLNQRKESYYGSKGIKTPTEIDEEINKIKRRLEIIQSDEKTEVLNEKIDELEKEKTSTEKKQKEHEAFWRRTYENLLNQEEIFEMAKVYEDNLVEQIEKENKLIDDLQNREGINEFENELTLRDDINKSDRYYKKSSIDDAKVIIRDATHELMQWSTNADENKSSVLANMRPFLQHFQSPEVERAISSKKPNADFNKIVSEGKVLVPNFPSSIVGKQLSNAATTLVKSRWQQAALADGYKNLGGEQRLKAQINDEWQRTCSIANEGQEGDLDYAEISRELGGINIFATQSEAAMIAKQGKSSNWDKIHGVCRNEIFFGTKEPQTLKAMKNPGQQKETRVNKTIQEGAASPHLDNATEKYEGQNSSLSVSYTESETMEDIIKTADLYGAEGYTSIGLLNINKRNETILLAHKPTFWPNKRDKWEVMKKCDFKPENRDTILWGPYIGSTIKFFKCVIAGRR